MKKKMNSKEWSKVMGRAEDKCKSAKTARIKAQIAELSAELELDELCDIEIICDD